jgi:hypothetical protein
VDFNEVFAPVTRSNTIWLVLTPAAKKGWIIYQLDVKSAFLHGELSKEVFVEQPRGYEVKGNKQKVYKLKKDSLWTETSSAHLLQSHRIIFYENEVLKIVLINPLCSLKPV